jgi:hypothetical protein
MIKGKKRKLFNNISILSDMVYIMFQKGEKAKGPEITPNFDNNAQAAFHLVPMEIPKYTIPAKESNCVHIITSNPPGKRSQ